MLGLPQTSYPRAIAFSGVSLLVHIALIASMPKSPKKAAAASYQKVAVQVKEKAVEKPAEKAAEEKPKDKAKPPEPKPPKAKASSQPQPAAAPTAQPVLGLSKESFAPDGKGSFAAPAGNTTNVPDEGKRLRPEDVQKLTEDLSADAKLIADSFVKPAYTPEAEDAGLEGSFVVEVYVDADGRVSDAELAKKVGYGMDKPLLEAALKSRFTPRKDALGRPLPGWTQIKLRFQPQ